MCTCTLSYTENIYPKTQVILNELMRLQYAVYSVLFIYLFFKQNSQCYNTRM